MEKILNQEEINALFRAVQGRKQPGQPLSLPPRTITACNFRQAASIAKEQLRSVSTLHETFARNLTRSLGAYLRVAFEVNLVSAEQLSYGEFLQRLPEVTYLASMNLRPLEATAAIEIDLSLAFPIIDSLLGGPGRPEAAVREITEIEEQILESVVRIIAREMRAIWQPVLEMEFVFDQRQQQAEILRLMPPNERILSLSFDIRMPEAQGALNVAIPAAVLSTLLRNLALQSTYRKHRTAPGGNVQLRKRLEHCRFPVELLLPSTRVPVSQVLNLYAGQVLELQRPLPDPCELVVRGKGMFMALPVRSGNRRAAKILRPLETSDPSWKVKP